MDTQNFEGMHFLIDETFFFDDEANKKSRKEIACMGKDADEVIGRVSSYIDKLGGKEIKETNDTVCGMGGYTIVSFLSDKNEEHQLTVCEEKASVPIENGGNPFILSPIAFSYAS